jgi:glycosyltransferase involved in cell wall biosynthesis
MNILVLADNPLNQRLGDGLRAFGLFAPLVRRHRFDLLCFARSGASPDRDAARVFHSVTTLPFPSAPARPPLQRAAGSLSLQGFRAQSEQMKTEVQRRIDSGNVDLVLDVACNMLLNLPLGALPVPLVIDSIDEALLRDLRDLRAAPWHDKPRFARQAFMFWRYERYAMARAHANIYVSEVDAATYRRIFPGRTASVVPNGVDIDYFRPPGDPPEPATLVFEGNLMFGPNVDAARRLALKILPIVRAAIPTARLILVGRDPAPEVRALAGDYVEVTGTVDDVRPFLARGTVFACPMRLGSGIKNKILQAWAMARPVVATPASLGGLAAQDGANLLVREDDRGFSDAVIELIRDPVRAAVLAARGRLTVEREYAWAHRAAQFEAELGRAVERWRAERSGTEAMHRRVAVATGKSPTVRS